MHCWSFYKQACWLNHWSLVIDLNLRGLPSSPRCQNTNLYSPPRELSIQSGVLAIPLLCGYRIVFRKSLLDLWKRVNLEFEETWYMKQEKKQTWIRKYQSKDSQGKGLEAFLILSQPCSRRLPHKGCVSCFPCSCSPHGLDILITLNNTGINTIR